jgi:hypothetical protein
VLTLLHSFAGYIGEFEIIDDHRSGKIVIQLNGRLNKTGVISPRFNVQVNQIESWVNLLLPARGFGKIILVGYSISGVGVYTKFNRGARRLRQGFLITRRLVVRTLVGSFSDMSTSCIICHVTPKTMPCILCMFPEPRCLLLCDFCMPLAIQDLSRIREGEWANVAKQSMTRC